MNGGEYAQIEALPQEQSGRILFARSVVAIRALNKAGPLIWITGVGLVIWGGIPKQTFGESYAGMRSLTLFFCGAALLCFAGLLTMRDLKNRWLRHIAHHEIKCRTGSIVDPDAAGVRFVEVVPTSNWDAKNMSENAADVGFLSIDFQNRCLSFEGDRERYRIPSSAVLADGQDKYSRFVTVDKYGARCEIRFYFVVIKVRLADGTAAEIPFRIRIGRGLFSDKNQRDGNAAFLKDIERLTKNDIKNAA
jgi:hypothetical protein